MEKSPFDFIDDVAGIFDRASNTIDKLGQGLDRLAGAFGPDETGIMQDPASIAATSEETVERGTACIPCSRDHISTVSSVLGEAVRFARSKGVKDPDVIRRVRIAFDELNAMERIDLAPDVVAGLTGKDKEMATWILNQSRDLRHLITAIKDPDALEKAAAQAAATTDTFMSQLMELEPQDSAPLESLKAFAKKRQGG